MEFNWNYRGFMRMLALDSVYCDRTNTEVETSCPYTVMLKFNIEGPIYSIPSFVSNTRELILQNENSVCAIPLCITPGNISATGAETIIKRFSRSANSRLCKINTPKGEVYYGTRGIILDENFDPLFLSVLDSELVNDTLHLLGCTIHLSPKVFLDDSKVINKHLAKKGISFYLSSPFNRDSFYTKVVIDDCSDYIVKAHKPDINNFSNKDVYKFLKENIGEILNQVAKDARNI